MSGNGILVKKWMEEYESGRYNNPEKSYELGWTDWWCLDKSLIRANKKVYNTLKKLLKADVIKENEYYIRLNNSSTGSFHININNAVNYKSIHLGWKIPNSNKFWGVSFGEDYSLKHKKDSIFEMVEFLKNYSFKETPKELKQSQKQVLSDIKEIRERFKKIYKVLEEEPKLGLQLNKLEGSPFKYSLEESDCVINTNRWGKLTKEAFIKSNKLD